MMVMRNGSLEFLFVLSHDKISMEPYSGNPFVVQIYVQALGIEFNWTINQEVMFSTALMGRPLRKEAFKCLGCPRILRASCPTPRMDFNIATWQSLGFMIMKTRKQRSIDLCTCQQHRL